MQIDGDRFADYFSKEWERLESKFFKYEAIQYYACDEGPILEAFRRGHKRKFVSLLKEYFLGEVRDYRLLESRGISSTRCTVIVFA